MDRVLRIIGVTIVVVVSLWTYRLFDRTVVDGSAGSVEIGTVAPTDGGSDSGSEDLGADRARGEDALDSTSPADAAGRPPRTLPSAVAGFPSGTYRVVPPAAPSSSRTDRADRADRTEPGLGFLDGDYPLETDLFPEASLAATGALEPGLYASGFDAEDCSYELHRFGRRGGERLIGQERLRAGRLLVSINEVEPDRFVADPHCGPWRPWSPLVEPLTRAGNGDYWIGDLARGLWAVPEGCLWEEVVAFRGGRLADVVDSGRGPRPLVVDDETLGVRIRDCSRVLRLIEPEPAPGPAGGLPPELDR